MRTSLAQQRRASVPHRSHRMRQLMRQGSGGHKFSQFRKMRLTSIARLASRFLLSRPLCRPSCSRCLRVRLTQLSELARSALCLAIFLVTARLSASDSIIEGGAYSTASGKSLAGPFIPRKNNNKQERENYMKKLLLTALVVCGFAFVPVQRSDAQVSVGIGGVGIGFGYPGYRYSNYGYPGYGYGYYPYGYSRPYPYYGYYGGPSFYWSGGHRVYYRHHRPTYCRI